MHIENLDYSFPEELIATEPQHPPRVLWAQKSHPPQELTWSTFLTFFGPEDLIVINDTKVIPARVFSETGLEITFIESLNETRTRWSVLCPLKRWGRSQESQILPDCVELRLIEGGLPQIVESSRPLDLEYFERNGELPLPPYIQKARGERHNRHQDKMNYQPVFAEKRGSLAAPTASLHFQQKDLEKIKTRGAETAPITLHVGLGTFLPVQTENLNDHRMHSETVSIPRSTWDRIQKTKARGGRVWALGTTVTRALESQARGKLSEREGFYSGSTDLFLKPGEEFQVVDALMTNFHQPKTTLLALVAAFAGLERMRECYAWALERRFRLFSYGDLSVWLK